MPKHNKNTAPARRKRRSPEEILQRILQAAGEEFSDLGYHNATTAAIARRADVTEAQVFRYFRSKAELFREAVFRPLDQRLAAFNDRHLVIPEDGADMGELSQNYIEALQGFIRENWKMIMALVMAQAYAPEALEGISEIDSLHTYFSRNADIMARRVENDSAVDPRLMVRVSFAAVLANVMFRDWLFPRGFADDDDISNAIIQFVLHGINANFDPGLSSRP